jgi:putative flippase GtrA
MRDESGDGAAARWFARFTTRIREALPPALQRVLPITFIGYAMINGSSFLLDMGFLALITQFVTWPYSIVFSIGYGLASIYAFFLNRWLNFREHGDLGKQSGKYVFVIVSNYLIWIVGFASILDLLGVHVMVARVMAACLEGLYIYILLRLWVFPRRRGGADEVPEGPFAEGVLPRAQPVPRPDAA